MFTKTKLAAALTALTLAATVAIPANDAHAGNNFGAGLAFGLVGGAVLGAAVASQAQAGPVYAEGYRRCRWVRNYDAYGFYVGKSRVCHYH
jgi:hypothetical protein